jgi:hypothetical protein
MKERSAFIERILRRFLHGKAQGVVQAGDLERINRDAERLNQEAADVLEYQASAD